MAASIWSLLIPAMDQSEEMGKFAFIPAADWILGWHSVSASVRSHHPTFAQVQCQRRGIKSRLQRTTMMVLAVTPHNIPEGMAVGVVYAGYLAGNAKITVAAAMALSIGIAIQNFPEGAIISMPLRAEGMKVSKAFAGGVLSGIVEPVGAMLTIPCGRIYCPGSALSVKLCGRSDDLCDCGGTDPGNVPGEHSDLWNDLFCSGIYGDDVAGCGSWVKITE